MYQTCHLLDVLPWMQDGDLLLYVGSGPVSFMIGAAGGCHFTHAAMLVIPRNHSGQRMPPEVLEVREGIGGRQSLLSNQLATSDGKIAWLPLDPMGVYDIDRAKAIKVMKSFTSKPYGWGGIKVAALSHLLGFRLFFWPDDDDEYMPTLPPYCSDAYSRAITVAGKDPIRGRAHRSTMPCHLFQSLLFDDPIFLTLYDEKTTTPPGDFLVAGSDLFPGRVA